MKNEESKHLHNCRLLVWRWRSKAFQRECRRINSFRIQHHHWTAIVARFMHITMTFVGVWLLTVFLKRSFQEWSCHLLLFESFQRQKSRTEASSRFQEVVNLGWHSFSEIIHQKQISQLLQLRVSLHCFRHVLHRWIVSSIWSAIHKQAMSQTLVRLIFSFFRRSRFTAIKTMSRCSLHELFTKESLFMIIRCFTSSKVHFMSIVFSVSIARVVSWQKLFSFFRCLSWSIWTAKSFFSTHSLSLRLIFSFQELFCRYLWLSFSCLHFELLSL